MCENRTVNLCSVDSKFPNDKQAKKTDYKNINNGYGIVI